MFTIWSIQASFFIQYRTFSRKKKYLPGKVVGVEQDSQIKEGLRIPDNWRDYQYYANTREAEILAALTDNLSET